MNPVVLKLGHRGFVTRLELKLLTFPRTAVVYIPLQLLLCGGGGGNNGPGLLCQHTACKEIQPLKMPLSDMFTQVLSVCFCPLWIFRGNTKSFDVFAAVEIKKRLVSS